MPHEHPCQRLDRDRRAADRSASRHYGRRVNGDTRWLTPWQLEAAGVDRDVAEARAAASQTAVDDRQEHVATKADLAHVEAAMEVRLAAMEARLTWRMVGLQIAIGGLIVAALKFIP